MNQSELWLAALRGNNAKAKKEATLAIGGLCPDDEIDISQFILGLDDHDEKIISWSIVALKRMGRASIFAVPQLTRIAIEHKAFGVRQAAILALSAICPESQLVKATIFSALKDPSDFVRRQALQACIQLKNLTAPDLLQLAEMSKDPCENVARWSGVALRNIALKATTRRND